MQSGGGIISPAFDLLDVAKRKNHLAETLTIVDAIPEPASDEQQRVKAALRAMSGPDHVKP